MITREYAEKFAQEWIDAWNSHNLERIISHYSNDFEMTTPFIVMVTGTGNGTLKGRDAVAAYWAKSLEKVPNLHFELENVYFSVDSICIAYKSVFGLHAVEYLVFDANRMVVKSSAHYNRLPDMPSANGK